jgi:hypothetical protein
MLSKIRDFFYNNGGAITAGIGTTNVIAYFHTFDGWFLGVGLVLVIAGGLDMYEFHTGRKK